MIKSHKGNIVVMGGSFNPPTIAHLHIANIAKNFLQAKACIFLPVGDTYNKKDMVSSTHRLHMLHSLISKNEGDCIETYEIDCTSPPTTYESLSHIRNKYGSNNEYYFVMGSDNLKKVSTWKNANELLDEFYIIILKREDMNNDKIINDDPFLKRYHDKIITLDVENDIIQYTSSSFIRNMRTLEETRLLLDPKIFEYIKFHKLYDFNDYY